MHQWFFRRVTYLRLCGLAFLLLLCTLPVLGQNAVVAGRVVDSSGAVVPGSALELRNTATNVVLKTTSNAEGLFVFPPVIPGVYDVTAAAPGFSTAHLNGMNLEIGQSRMVNLTLSPSAIAETVTVDDVAPLLTTDRSDRGTVVENQFLVSIPLPTRNPLLLVTLTAGVTPGNVLTAGDNSLSQNQTNEFRINGGRMQTSEVLIDGASNTTTYNNQVAAIPQVDAIQEFKVYTNPYDAEFGHTGGGVISYTIKSGTNSYHGNLHEFLQNQLLNANGFDANRAKQPRVPYRKNQYGFTLGGPLQIPKLYNGRDRTFFFFAYEGFRWNTFFPFVGTVPTDAQRKGDFSQTFDTNGALKVIYNPYTTRLDPSAPQGTIRYIRDTFPGNLIPQNLLNPVAKNLLPYYPLPNTTGVGKSDTNNYIRSAFQSLENDRIDGRIDHQFSQRHSMFARGNWFEQANIQPQVYGNLQAPVQAPNVIPGENWMVNDTWAFTPHTIYVQRFSVATSQTNRVPLTLGFDVPSLGFPSSITKGMRMLQFPSLTLGGYSALSNSPYYTVSIMRTYQYANSLTMLRGAHTLKAGLDYRYYTVDWNVIYPLRISTSGAYTGGPNAKAAAANTGSGLADLLLGAAAVSYQINPHWKNNHPYYGAYFQDEWRVTSRLTLTMGLRYSLELPSIETNNQYVYLDLTSPSPLQVPGYNLKGGLGFVGIDGKGRRVQTPDRNNWEPRLGLAYRMQDMTVLRAGFGVFHHPYISTSIDTSLGFQRTTANLVTEADTVTPLFNLANPFPGGILEPTGNALGLGTLLGQAIRGPIREQRMPYQAQWSVDIERQLPLSIMAGIGYTGTANVALPARIAYNQLHPDQLALGSQLTKPVPNPFYGYITDPSSTLSRPTVQYAQLLRPYPQFTGMDGVTVPSGHSNYHAMELKVERRFAQGLAVLFNYTRSKLIDNVAEINNGPAASFNNIYCFACDRALSYLDIPNYVNLSVRYELPFGLGKRMLNRGLLARVAGNWSLAGIYSYASGIPVVVSSPNDSNAFNIGISRPIATGQPAALPGGPRIEDNGAYFNTAAFTRTPQFQFGNVSRQLPDVRTPGKTGLNALIEKQIPITERFRLEFRTELFNATNSTNFKGPQTSITSAAFGTIALTQSNVPRVIQFALRLVF
ncbi:MAG: TonB-dependent receptor [Bryobacteraceae bacterium]|nr:carboxypeptidase regulatory-like domain-containing protein [Bryobacterales bacterium]MEB2364413.1 carboxypeptidase regulatory-like domain-containing protein [Bryobacterales bacterium]NUN03867.1 TonB-dependent receptor [Bryobacteraceae bacterium]